MIIRKGEEHMKWLIKNGTIASEEKTFLADLLLEDDKIIKIDTNIEDAEAKCIDAEGCYVMPGAVDIHTHMDLDVGIASLLMTFIQERLLRPVEVQQLSLTIWHLDQKDAI